MIQKRLVVLIAVLGFLLVASCASTPPKEAAVVGETILNLTRDLNKAYEKRDIEAFMDKVAASYPDRDKFRQAIEQVFAAYPTITFTVQETRMLVTIRYKGAIETVFTWAGEWQTAGGKILKDGGRVTLVLDPSTHKLTAIEGKNPYLPTEATMPVTQP